MLSGVVDPSECHDAGFFAKSRLGRVVRGIWGEGSRCRRGRLGRAEKGHGLLAKFAVWEVSTVRRHRRNRCSELGSLPFTSPVASASSLQAPRTVPSVKGAGPYLPRPREGREKQVNSFEVGVIGGGVC